MADLYGEDVSKGKVFVFHPESDSTIQAADIVQCTDFEPNSSNVFLVDFSAVNNERFATMPCFGDKTYVFAYGHDINTSRSTVTLLVFMAAGENCEIGSGGKDKLGDLIGFYADNRLSQNGGQQTIMISGKSGFASGYLVSMQVRAYNPGLNAVTVTATFMTAPPASN